jgi:ERCC4-type nuclease
LTWDEAEFLLWDEKQVKAADAEIRRRLRERGAKPQKKKLSAGDYLKSLRKWFTGSEDRDG